MGGSKMLCQNCQQKTATVHLTKVIDSDKTELHLCDACAKSAGGELSFMSESSFTFQNLIASLLDVEWGLYQPPSSDKGVQCPNCGLTFFDFKKSGLLGCGECYRSFKSGLEPLFKKVHGSNRHTGKVPIRTGGKVRIRKEIEDLRSQLQQAIGREDYEKAAMLRDEIRRREQEL
jgi:protein arginine kinase activator